MANITKDFGPRLRKRRDLLQLTQADAARACGVSVNAYTQWERGVAFPHMRNIKSVSEFLGIELDELLEFAR